MPVHMYKYVDKLLGYHANYQEVSRCCARDESEEYIAYRLTKPGFETPGQTSPEIQNWGISGPTKRTNALQKF